MSDQKRNKKLWKFNSTQHRKNQTLSSSPQQKRSIRYYFYQHIYRAKKLLLPSLELICCIGACIIRTCCLGSCLHQPNACFLCYVFGSYRFWWLERLRSRWSYVMFSRHWFGNTSRYSYLTYRERDLIVLRASSSRSVSSSRRSSTCLSC